MRKSKEVTRKCLANLGHFALERALTVQYQSSTSLIHRITIPDSWVRYTQENIARSQKERAASERLRGEIDSTLRACANEMWNQFNSVNNSFNTRIRETTDARNKLQAHLQRVSKIMNNSLQPEHNAKSTVK